MVASSKNSLPDEAGSLQASASRPALPPLRALAAFEAAARMGSFAEGARDLAVTPSAISHQIQLLESVLGLKLFRRHAGRASLTDAGQLYAAEIGRAMEMIADATARIAPDGHAGPLTIAASPSLAAKWLQPRLTDFLRACPQARVRLATLSGSTDLDEAGFDLAIVYGLPVTRRHVEPLLSERLRPLCSPALAHRLGLREPADLAGATLIHSANAVSWADYALRVGIGTVRPKGELWLDRSTMAIEAAVTGLGVVLESEILAAGELARGDLIAPFGERFVLDQIAYYLVRSSRPSSGSMLAAFEKWLRLAVEAFSRAPDPVGTAAEAEGTKR